jgi:hypothetical protein
VLAPDAGNADDERMRRIGVVVGLVASIGCDSEKNLDSVAKDNVERYEIAKRAGAVEDTCTMATATAQSYLAAKNEAEYKKWKAVQATDCAKAGTPAEGTPVPPAPTKSAEPVDIAIAGLADWKAKMCDCSDKACADKTHEDYKKWENDTLEPMFKGIKESDLPKDKMEKAEKLDDERKACRRSLADAAGSASMAEAMAKMSEFKNMMCSCKDADCAKKVSDEMTRWSQEQAGKMNSPPKMSEADMKKATEIGTAMGECMQKAMGMGSP